MIGTAIVPRSTNSAHSVKKNSPSGVLNRRNVTSKPPGSPRVNCKSSFGAAFKNGGLQIWIAHKLQNLGVSSKDLEAKPAQAKSAIGAALRLSIHQSADWCNKFRKILAEAEWYDIDFKNVIGTELWKMPREELNVLKTVCQNNDSLAWLKSIINENSEDRKNSEADKFSTRLKGKFFESLELCSEGKRLGDAKQNIIWTEMDDLCKSLSDSDLSAKISKVISDLSPWQLLPYAEMRSKEIPVKSRTLEEYCLQALKVMEEIKAIDFSEFNDVELKKFSILVSETALEKHTLACQAELVKRAHTAKCNKLELRLKNQLSLMLTPTNSPEKHQRPRSDVDYFEGFSAREICLIVSKAIATIDVKSMVILTKREPNNDSEAWFIEIAKENLNKGPNVRMLTQEHLVAYLNLSDKDLSPFARQRVLQEAEVRSAKSIEKRYEILEKGLRSDSSDELVLAVWEFSKLAIFDAKLELAVGFGAKVDLALKLFSGKLDALDATQLMRAKKLSLLLLKNFDSKTGAQPLDEVLLSARHLAEKLLNRETSKSRPGDLKDFTERDNRLMSEAITHYFPTAIVPVQPAVIPQPVDATLSMKIVDAIQSLLSSDAGFRKVRTPDGEEIPVCDTFMKDQPRSIQDINGRPVFSSHIRNKFDRAREFVRQMRGLKKINEKQIMMASRIATQTITTLVPNLARDNKLFSLIDAESKKLEIDEAGSWLYPTGLSSKQNFSMDNKGNLIINVRIANDNTKIWNGEYRTPSSTSTTSTNPTGAIETDPENSYFLLDLMFEVDTFGEIKKCVPKNLTSARDVLQIAGS